MNLEEALAKIAQLEKDKQKILDEKKDMLKLFDEKDKEEMTETEKKIAKILEEKDGKLSDLEKKLEQEKSERQKAEADRAAADKAKIDKAVAERLEKVAKGDTDVLKKLQANIGLLEALPKTTDSELDTAVNMAYNMMGAGSVNPLSATNATGGNTAEVEKGSTFGETAQGKAVASKIGLSFAKDKEGDGK